LAIRRWFWWCACHLAAGPTRQPHLSHLSLLYLLSSLFTPLSSNNRRPSPACTSQWRRSTSSPGWLQWPAVELQLARRAALLPSSTPAFSLLPCSQRQHGVTQQRPTARHGTTLPPLRITSPP
jgi:hypothetical protein